VNRSKSVNQLLTISAGDRTGDLCDLDRYSSALPRNGSGFGVRGI